MEHAGGLFGPRGEAWHRPRRLNRYRRARRRGIRKLDALIAGNRQLRWPFAQCGFWAHGVKDLRGYLACAALFTLEGRGRAGKIRCPTLLTAAGGDTRSGSAQKVMDGLCCPKTLIAFSDAEGAGDHCEMMNRSLLNRRALDWLDVALGIA